MPDNLGLLLNPVLFKLPSGFQAVIIATERVTPQRQAYAFLVLPHMHQLVNEVALQSKVAVAKIGAE